MMRRPTTGQAGANGSHGGKSLPRPARPRYPLTVMTGPARQPDPQVSIIMPCLNEAGTLPWCIERARQALGLLARDHGLRGEIVVADNGSTDGSQTIAERLGARVVPVAREGYGAALQGGLNAARGQYLIMGDCDCSYDFVEAVPMVGQLLEGAELCLGSRFRGAIQPGAMPWLNRHFGNPALTGILRIIYRFPVSDAHCGLRALTKATFQRLRLESDGMEFATEMVLKAALLNCRYAELPVTLAPDRRGRPPHLRPWRDGWRHLRYLLMLSPNWLFFGPAGAFTVLALIIGIPLLLQPDGTMIKMGGLAFGDHWMILAAAFLVVGFQTGLFGLASTIHGVREGYRPLTLATRRLMWLARLEHFLGLTLVLLLTSGALFLNIFLTWADAGFGGLSAVRDMTAAATMGGLGMQSLFGGFLLAIIAGNRAQPDALVIKTGDKA